MPEACGVEALADWLDAHDINGLADYDAMARAVRALLESKVRDAISVTVLETMAFMGKKNHPAPTPTPIIASVLGAP